MLILGDREWILADRGKWAEQRLLRFDLEELLGRRDQATLEAVSALLHRETLAPESGTSLVDTLDDSSHKHAYAVSEDLKYALQASIEAIGNEAIRYRVEVSKKKVYGEEIKGQDLALECIRYMYRVLFLLYIEARPELGYAPMGSEAYRLGYSFDRLRDLEIVELETEEARNGFTIDLSLRKLFDMVYGGAGPASQQQTLLAGVDRVRRDLAQDADRREGSIHHTFGLVPLKCHLFDPARTPFLDKVKLRNEVLLDVIRAMSLSKPQGTGSSKRRGRISYATLGINQLGAVYEALLAFRGFFAEETLYEVKPADKDDPDPVNDPAYFVPESDLHRYSDKERVFNDDGTPRSYPPGTFIYRMAGRDRQKSASYYTPEVLTRCLVKYALKELLEDEHGDPKHARAEDLLELRICEPAMGSAAFLNEAINQLAERYLQRRQHELGERIPHDRYAHELQQVRMYLADNNVYGVDLNPVALELAETSLWLNAIFTRETEVGREVFVPWFGGQLCCGNSLVGAWRKVFTTVEVDAGSEGNSCGWLDAVPERVPLGQQRPEGSVYHFLLPDRGMAVYGQGSEGKPIKEMCASELKTIEGWRRQICQPLSDSDRNALVRLSDAVDRLWFKHVELLAKIRKRTTDPLSVYGHDHSLKGQPPTTTLEKDRIWRHEMASEQVRASSPYRRLKLAMDYWCALWFWPIERAELMPDRDEWLTDLALLLDSEVLPGLHGADGQMGLFAPTMDKSEAQRLVDEVGFADVERLIERWPRLRLADDLAKRYRFHHWELEFADLFALRGGFDLILGNPPWIRLEWNESSVLGDSDPRFGLHILPSSQMEALRVATLSRVANRGRYLQEYEGLLGTQGFLTSNQNYPALEGIQPNLYKCFLPVCWTMAGASCGVTGLVTDKGLFSDPGSGRMRAESYRRLRFHFQFRNQFSLFQIGPGDNNKEFELSIYGPTSPQIRFISCGWLLHPSTIDESFRDRGERVPPGIKDEDGQWVIQGHKERLLLVTERELSLFARLFDDVDIPFNTARLPSIHSAALLSPLERIAESYPKLCDEKANYFSTAMFDETKATKKTGLFERQTSFPSVLRDWVISGPHFYVANPVNKTPRAVCNTQNAYDSIDLMCIPSRYFPRTNFRRVCSEARLTKLLPKVPWADDMPVTTQPRLVFRRQLSQGGERTLIAALMPKEVIHLHSVLSFVFSDHRMLLLVGALMSSVVFDFFVKATGRGDLYESMLRQLPLLPAHARGESELRVRFAASCCLTEDYADIWRATFTSSYCDDNWADRARRLDPAFFRRLSPEWRTDRMLRRPYERRQALVEVDVITSMALGFTLAELKDLYRIQFPVSRQYEADTWYDRCGRVVFTNNSRGLPGVGLQRGRSKGDPNPSWNEVQHMSEEAGYTGNDTVTQVVIDDTLPGGPREKTIVYQAPWVRCDREKDYEVAWKHFADRFGREGA